MDKKSQLKTIGILAILLGLLLALAYAVSTGLNSPVENFIDDDGYLVLQGQCVPTIHDGTTSFNITNATVYSNVDGTWKANKTLHTSNSIGNATYLFNFTNTINQSAEGTFKWNILCWEQNTSNHAVINSAFGTNRTITVTYAEAAVSSFLPENNAYDLDGRVNITAVVTATSGWNLTNVTLFTNQSGWSISKTYGLTKTIDGFLANFSLSGLSDGARIVFSLRTIQEINKSPDNFNELVISEAFTSNRTIVVEYPPNSIALNSPANDAWISNLTTLNITISSAFREKLGFEGQLWTNETGTWSAATSFSAVNRTDKLITYQFAELSDIRWGVKAVESDDANVFNFSQNSTVHVDRTSPIVSLTFLNQNVTWADNLYTNKKNMTINYTVTERNPTNCQLHINRSLNMTDTSLKPASSLHFEAVSGKYNVTVGCLDSAGNTINSSVYTLFVDRIFPTFNGVNNISVINSADDRKINTSISEEVNMTAYYGTTTDVSSIVNVAGYVLNPNATLTNLISNTVYYFNLTVCDRAGNCNQSGQSLDQFDFTFPFSIKGPGWSYFGIYDSKINFSRILNESSTEFVYYWNQTGQHWVSATAGGTTNMGFEVGISVGERTAGARHVVVLYESINSTWVRNTTNSGNYQYNFTSGDNFVKLPTDFTFGNLSLTLFNTTMKSKVGEGDYNFGVEESTVPGNTTSISSDPPSSTAGGIKYNLTDFRFSAYNLTAVTWEPYYVYNFTEDNNTILTPLASGVNNFEVVWIFSLKNLTWNSTNIIGNWTFT